MRCFGYHDDDVNDHVVPEASCATDDHGPVAVVGILVRGTAATPALSDYFFMPNWI